MTRSGWTSKRQAHRHPLILVREFLRTFLLTYLLILFYAVKQQVTICSSALEACKTAEAVVIATEWKEFREIDWETVYKGMNKPAFVFDGRLLVDADMLRKIGFSVCTCGF